jgi:uncharacterized protein (TIGR03083 family)
MDVRQYLEALESNGCSLVETSRGAELQAPVPTCPGWQLSDLLAHIGFVHRWAATYVQDGLTEKVDEPDEESVLSAAPRGESLREWVEQGHAALVRALSSAPEDLRCWTFLECRSVCGLGAKRTKLPSTG